MKKEEDIIHLMNIDLNTLSIDELEIIMGIIWKSEYNSNKKAILKQINKRLIEEKDRIKEMKLDKINNEILETQTMNKQFDFTKEPFKYFIPKTEKDILEYNGITNLQQLLDVNLSQLVDESGRGIGEHTKESLDWIRNNYDMRTFTTLQKNSKEDNNTPKK